jgi:RNA polymerase sigma-70 factor (ECF subfamily)
LTEDELIRGCLQADGSCQKEIFNRFAGRMLGVCNRYARNSADAEDILQDAFIKVFDKVYQFKFEGSFEGIRL